MNCWHCNTELIWGGDNDCEDIEEEYSFVTNLHCPKCESYVEVYYPNKIEMTEEKEVLWEPWQFPNIPLYKTKLSDDVMKYLWSCIKQVKKTMWITVMIIVTDLLVIYLVVWD